MSGEGIGEAVAMLVFAGGAVAWYGLKGAAWLTYHGVRGAAKLTVAAGKAAHAAYVASEARRRAKALEELKAVEGAMARSTESLLEEISAAEEASEKLRAEAVRKMDEEWDASLAALESKGDHVAEAMVELREFHTKRASELTASLAKATKELEVKLDAECDAMCDRAVKRVTAEAAEAQKKLDEAEMSVEERKGRYLAYASSCLKQAEEILALVERNYECDKFHAVAAELVAVRASIAGLKEAIASGAASGASASGALVMGSVQALAVHAEQATRRFNRDKAEVDEATAKLMQTVEASHELLTEDTPEEVQEFISEEMDAAFWSEGRLEKLWQRAEKLAEKAASFDPRDDATIIAQEARELELELMSEYTRTRMHILGKNEVLKLARKIIESHAENGWEQSEDPAYLGGDCRRELRLAFEKDGDTRVVIVRNKYNPATGLYEQQIVRYADEAGMPDEASRRREDKAINESMSALGVDERLHVTCDNATAGQKRRA